MAKMKLFCAGLSGPMEVGGLGVVMFNGGLGDKVLDDSTITARRIIGRLHASRGIVTVPADPPAPIPPPPLSRKSLRESRAGCDEESPPPAAIVKDSRQTDAQRVRKGTRKGPGR